MKFEVFVLQLNANVTETLLQDYYNENTVVDLNQIGFKIAFAVQNEDTNLGYDDPTYVQWVATMMTNSTGDKVYTNLKTHKCTDNDYSSFFPPSIND